MSTPATHDRAESRFQAWFEGTWHRSTERLSFAELRRSVQALSRRYVQKRESLGDGAALQSDGKRAAFAAFYGPLHYRLLQELTLRSGLAQDRGLKRISDLGCGTGVASAGWCHGIQATRLETSRAIPFVDGYDRSSWALGEARRSWTALGIAHRTRRIAMEESRDFGGRDHAMIAAWAINELSDASRETLLRGFRRHTITGGPILIVEPISRRAAPWWPAWSDAFVALGGSAQEWTLSPELPERWWDLGRAAGLDHAQVKVRTLLWRPTETPEPT